MRRYAIQGKIRECRGITKGGSRKYGPVRLVSFPAQLNGGINPPHGYFYCNGKRYIISSTYSVSIPAVENSCIDDCASWAGELCDCSNSKQLC